MSVDRLCFGTSTFAAGRLCPDKDSAPGIAALAEALGAGVRLVHSNPSLGTQWAVREAVDAADRPQGIKHLIKVELPLDASTSTAQAMIEGLLSSSIEGLGTNRLHAAVIEVDLKRTVDRSLLVDGAAVTDFYQRAAELALSTDMVNAVIGYCHSPAHLSACMKVPTIRAYAAQYNLIEAWPALHFDDLQLTQRPFVGMAPLRRGLLVNEAGSTGRDRLRALRWVLGHPAVWCTAITISSITHLSDVLEAAEMPLPASDVERHARAWQQAGTVSTRPQTVITS